MSPLHPAATLAALALAAAVAPALAQSHACPAQLRLDPAGVALATPAPGFTPLVGPLPLPLTGASAYDGPPEEGAVLKPASERRSAQGLRTVWHFAGRSDAGHWLSCDYAQGLLRLTVPVEATSTRCEALSTQAPGPGRTPPRLTIQLSCR